MVDMEQENRANQLNPNNDAYWQARGWNRRPADWQDRVGRNEEPPANQQRRRSTR